MGAGLIGTGLAALLLGLPALPSDVIRKHPAAPDTMLVSTAWLAERLRDPSIVVIHVAGPRAAYDSAHLPGARYLPYEGFVVEGGHGKDLSTQLPSVAQLDSALESIGVSDSTRVVLYGPASAITERLFFTLDYLGLADRAYILDGGLHAWRAEGRPVTTEVPAVTRGSLTPRPRPDLVVDAAFVQGNLNRPALAILDARTPDFYTGTSGPSRHAPRPGHIPSARNIPFTTLMDSSSRKLKDKATLAGLFRAAGAEAGDRVVAYCHIGQQASLLYFVARYLGYDARLYDGSFEDWSKRTELPVEGPAK